MNPDRYARQTILSEIGDEGQKKLSQGTVAIVGLGALGTVNSTLLARAGVGKLLLVDRDVIELNNLQRQLIYNQEHVGESKAAIAFKELRKVNSDVDVEGMAIDLNHQNVVRLLKGADVVVDGTDNMETRFLLNDYCVKTGIPFIYGGSIATYGMTLTVAPSEGPCLRCLFPQTPVPGTLPTCDTFGILNTIPAMIASIQSTEAIKLLIGVEPRKTLMVLDPWYNDQREVEVTRRDDCICCVKNEFDFLDARTRNVVVSLCGQDACSVTPSKDAQLSLDDMKKRLEKVGKTKAGIATLTLFVDGYEIVLFKDGRALIKGTDDESKAKSIYSQYIGY
ncbi:MAG: ThiF family adenylyltransferase [Thermoplasmata archaeon]|nr:ThiF family adenylyltransferase [Thermoplasmata archaeon]